MTEPVRVPYRKSPEMADRWQALPEVQWRVSWANARTPVLEQKWQNLATGEMVWRIVQSVEAESPVIVAPVENDAPRLRAAIEAIRPHTDAWIALLAAYVQTLSRLRPPNAPDHGHAKYELAVMRHLLAVLLAA